MIKRHRAAPKGAARCFLFTCRYYFDLAQGALGNVLHGHAGTGGLGGKVLCVHGVELGEILYVSQKAGGLDNVLKTKAAGLQYLAHVFAGLLRLLGDCFALDISGGGVDGNLA